MIADAITLELSLLVALLIGLTFCKASHSHGEVFTLSSIYLQSIYAKGVQIFLSLLWSVSHSVPGCYRQLFLRKAFDDLLVEGSKTPQDEIPTFLNQREKHVEEVMKVRC